jgi:hypothetical protein
MTVTWTCAFKLVPCRSTEISHLVSIALLECGRLCGRASCLPSFLSAAILKSSFHDPSLIFFLSVFIPLLCPSTSSPSICPSAFGAFGRYGHDHRRFPKSFISAETIGLIILCSCAFTILPIYIFLQLSDKSVIWFLYLSSEKTKRVRRVFIG